MASSLPRILTSITLAIGLVVAPLPTVVTQAKGPETKTREISVSRGQTKKVETPKAKVSVVGATWRGNTGVEKAEYRSKDNNGQWSGWKELPVDDADGPDAGTGEAGKSLQGTESLVVPEGTSVEIRTAQKSDLYVAETGITGNVRPGGAVAGAAPAHAAGGSKIGGFTYTSRKDWGAKGPRKGCPVEKTKVNKAVIIHHTSGSNSYSQSQVPSILRGIQGYHQNGRKWCDIGYNMVVDKWGNIYEARSGGLTDAVIGAHAGGFNTSTFGVAVLGTYSKPVNSSTLNSLKKIVSWQGQLWGYDPSGKVKLTSKGGTSKYKKGTERTLPRVFGHRDVGNTDCPGNGLYSQLPKLRISQPVKPGAPIVSDGIKKYYSKHKDETGPPQSPQRKTGKGVLQNFKNGVVYQSKQGVYFTAYSAPMRKVWSQHGWENGRLGFPKSDRYKFGYGWRQSFEGGAIIEHSRGTYPVWGGIQSNWERNKGAVKYPVSVEKKIGGKKSGSFQHFENGSIHWSKKTGAHYTNGGIRNTWSKHRWEQGRLGYPTSDPFKSGDRVRQNFEGGAIIHSKRGTHPLWGGMKANWERNKATLRNPVSTEKKIGGKKPGAFQHFEHGSVHWSKNSGAHYTNGAIRNTWKKHGWEQGRLGYPTTDPYKSGDEVRQKFQGGTVVYHKNRGTYVAWGRR